MGSATSSAMDDDRAAQLYLELDDKGGSGYAITSNYILTAHHVLCRPEQVGPSKDLVVQFRLWGDLKHGDEDWKVARFLWSDRQRDVALLGIDDQESAKSQTLSTLKESKTKTILGRLPATGYFECETFGWPRVLRRGDISKPMPFRGKTTARGRSPQENIRAISTELTPKNEEDWKGMSGAALWIQGAIVGVVVDADPRFKESVLDIQAFSAIENGAPFWTYLADCDVRELVASTSESALLSGLRPEQAPFLPQHFVHRVKAEKEVIALLLRESDSLQIIAIQGMGGLGKSTLASAVATHPSVVDRFSDGVLWTEFRPESDLIAILNGWLHVLGDPFESTSVEALSGLLRTKLQHKAVLVVLDNVWDAETIRPCLVGGPQCRVLITTRQIDVAEELKAELFELNPFSVDESLKLLEKRLGQLYHEGELTDKLAVVEATGGLPLALELASARIQRGKSWTDLKAGLQGEIARLESPKARRGNKGQMGLEATFNLSIDELRKYDEQAWQSFCWLGVLSEDAVLNASVAATLFDVSEIEADDLLELLWSDALLSRSPRVQVNGKSRITYRVHNLLHALARDRLCKRKPDGLGYSLPEAHQEFIQRLREKAGAADDQPLALSLQDDGYAHAHLIWHLERAGHLDAVHSLLREESPQGGNAWLQARQRLAQMPGFLADVAHAWRSTDASADADLKEGSRSNAAILGLRYAMMTTSLHGQLRNVPAKLVARLVEVGKWTAAQGLDFARSAGWNAFGDILRTVAGHLSELEIRNLGRINWKSDEALLQLASVAAIAQYLPHDLASELIEQIMLRAEMLRKSVMNFVPNEPLMKMMGVFWQLMPEGLALALAIPLREREREEMYDRLLTKIGDSSPLTRDFTLAFVAPHVSESKRTKMLQEFLEDLSTLRDHLRKETLAMQTAMWSSPQMLPMLQQQMAMERAIMPGGVTEEARQLSARQLLDKILPELESQHSVDSLLAELLTRIAPYLPDSLQSKAIEAIWTIENENIRFNVLSKILANAGEPQKTAELERAFRAAYQLKDKEESFFYIPRRFEVLAFLAPCLTEKHWQRLFEDISNVDMSNDSSWRGILVKFIPYAPQQIAEQLEHKYESLNHTESFSISHGYDGSTGWFGEGTTNREDIELWIAKLPKLDEQSRRDLILRILHFTDLPHDSEKTLERIGPWLVEPDFREILRQVQSWNTAINRTPTIESIAPWLPASLASDALEVASSILDLSQASEALWEVAKSLSLAGMQQDAMEAAYAIRDPFLRSSALIMVGLGISGAERERALAAALESSRSVAHGEYRYRGNSSFECRSVAIAQAALPLSEPLRSDLFREALACEQAERDGHSFRVASDRALVWLCYLLAKAGHSAWALDTAASIQDEEMFGWAQISMAPLLQEAQLEDVLTAVLRSRQPESRVRLLASLAPHLPSGLVERVLRVAEEMEQPDRLTIWIAVAPKLAEQTRETIIRRALDLAREVNPAAQVQTTAALYDYLPENEKDKLTADALRMCGEMEDTGERANVFSALVARVDGSCLDRAAEVVTSRTDEQWRDRMLSAIFIRRAETGRVDKALKEISESTVAGWMKAHAICRIAPLFKSEPDVKKALEIIISDTGGYFTRTDTIMPRTGKYIAQRRWSASLSALGALAAAIPSALLSPPLLLAIQGIYKQLLHRLTENERSVLLLGASDLIHLSSALAGKTALPEVSLVIRDVVRWWP